MYAGVEGLGRFRRRRVPACVGVGSGGKIGGRFRPVGGRVAKVPEGSRVVCCLATLTGAAVCLF